MKLILNEDYDVSKPVDVSKFKFTNYRNPDGTNYSGRETYRKAMIDWSEQTEILAKRVVKRYWGEMIPKEQLSIEYYNLNNHSTLRDLVSPSSEQGLKDVLRAIIKRQQYLINSVSNLVVWDIHKKEWVSKNS